MDSFSCQTRIITGAGSLSQLGQLGIRKLLLVTDPYFYENGTAQKVATLSGASRWEIFHQVTPDPSVELAAAGTAVLRKFQPDTVVALGGGSTMDCAKAMVYFGNCPVTLVAIPTTSGSGSEVTDFAVLTHGAVKYPLVDPRLCPKWAILDSELLEKLPAGLVGDTGFDVLSHALEALVATGATVFTDALAKDAFCRVFSLLPRSFAGDITVRGEIHGGATMAGIAFSGAGLGLCHAMAHALGGVLHLPHGRLNAILLPAVIEYNRTAVGKYAALARWAGLGGSADTVAVRNLKNGLIHLRHQLQMPGTLTEAGADPRLVRQKTPEILAATFADPCCKTNPVAVQERQVRGILETVTGHG